MSTRKPPKKKNPEAKRARPPEPEAALPERTQNGHGPLHGAYGASYVAAADDAPPSSGSYSTFDEPPPELHARAWAAEGDVAESDATPPEEPAAELPAMSVAEVEDQIRSLELQLDRMIQKSKKKNTTPEGHAERAARALAERFNVPADIERPGGDDGNVMDAARELLSSDYYLRQWGRIAMRNRSEDVDEFGLDPKYAARWQPLFDFLYKRYFRVETTGAANIPSEGRCLIVANHSGTFPYDGAILKTAMQQAHPAKRDFRWLAEDFIFYLPFLGAFMNRIGAVRACQENAERLLKDERLVGVFPEGVKGIGKLYRDRYKLQRFGRGGFIRLCLRTETPIVPCAVIGAEEAT
ncbi:MAG TPA: lysophospholipid acyltransferase family protein, partial [Polyangiaceae bacterium]|nr:lysophospholipid acyltransferase family protein [Polyangiaceae bacterium]